MVTGGDTIKTFGEKLKSLRVSAGLTQEALAQKCNLKKQSISRYEKSDREPNIRIAKNIADALGVPLSALVPNSVIPPVDFPFDDTHALLIKLFDQLSPESRAFVLAQLRGAVQSQKDSDSRG